MFCRPWESMPPRSSWKALGSVAGLDYGVDGRLTLAAKSLYSCSDVCVRVGRMKWPFTVGVGLRQRSVLSPLLFIVYISGRIRPADQFNSTRQMPYTFFFKCHVSDCGQQCNCINCCLPSKSHCTRLFSGQAVANSALGSKSFATPGLHELDRQLQPSQGGRLICELQDQPLTFCRRFGTASIFSAGCSACTRSVLRCVWPRQNEN